VAEATAQGTDRERIGEVRLGTIHSGHHYVFGFGQNFYGIWDVGSVAPLERFPANLQGKREGWVRFVEMEPTARDVNPPWAEERVGKSGVELAKERARRTRRIWLISAAVVIVGAVVAVIVVSKSTSTSVNVTGPGGKANAAHVDVSGATTVSQDLTLQSFTANGLNSLFGKAEATWKGSDVTLHILLTNPQNGDNLTAETNGSTLELTTSSGEFDSTRGECTITITGITESAVGGSFSCKGVPSTSDATQTVDVKGTFSGQK
jgi:hypothetical protein